jgi:hypothetical protein
MNQRDRELLEKQFAWLQPAPQYGSLKLAVTAATLLVGIAIGSTMVLHDPNSAVTGASTSALPPILASYDAGKRSY